MEYYMLGVWRSGLMLYEDGNHVTSFFTKTGNLKYLSVVWYNYLLAVSMTDISGDVLTSSYFTSIGSNTMWDASQLGE